MRAHELLSEHAPRVPVQTLKGLNQLKCQRGREETELQWRREYLYPMMYSRTDRRLELIDVQKADLDIEQQRAELERERLETAQMKAEYDAFVADYGLESRIAVDAMAEKEIIRKSASKGHIAKLARSEMRRRKD